MKDNNKLIDVILKEAEKERYNLNHPYVGSEHLLLSILKNKNNVSDLLKTYKVSYTSFKKELINVVGNATKDFKSNLYTPLLRKIIKRSETINKNNTDIYDNLFISLLDEGEGIAVRILLHMDVDLDEIYINLKEKQKLNNMEESNKIGILLNKTINTNDNIVGRDKEIEKLILSLTRKNKCNPLLIGPAGVGKTAIVEELVRRIKKNNVPDNLKNYQVYEIEMGSLISGTKYRGDFEDRLNKIIKEIIYNKKTIIFIDEIHTMVGAGGAEGAINAADILKPYLARGELKCIGATTYEEYNKSILKDKALLRRFDLININEPSKTDMYKLLDSIKKEYESFHNIKVSSKLLNKIVDLSDYYMKNIVNPDKSIDLLDSSCAYAKMNHKLKLTEEDILNVIYNKTNNCFINIKKYIKTISHSFNKYFNKNITNKIINAFKNKNNLPISFIVDNTKVSNILKEELKDINIIKYDINTNKSSDLSVFNSLINKPYSLVDIYNVEYSNKDVINNIINVNKEGFINNSNNEKIYFNNAVIILNLNNNELYETGFNKTNKTKRLNQELVDSFSCDLRNISIKEYTNI